MASSVYPELQHSRIQYDDLLMVDAVFAAAVLREARRCKSCSARARAHSDTYNKHGCVLVYSGLCVVTHMCVACVCVCVAAAAADTQAGRQQHQQLSQQLQ